jgi:hypothetical protein
MTRVILLAFLLSGCAGSFEFPVREREPVIVEPPPVSDAQCFVRARRFQGLVQVNCAEVIRETRG